MCRRGWWRTSFRSDDSLQVGEQVHLLLGFQRRERVASRCRPRLPKMLGAVPSHDSVGILLQVVVTLCSNMERWALQLGAAYLGQI